MGRIDEKMFIGKESVRRRKYGHSEPYLIMIDRMDIKSMQMKQEARL